MNLNIKKLVVFGTLLSLIVLPNLAIAKNKEITMDDIVKMNQKAYREVKIDPEKAAELRKQAKEETDRLMAAIEIKDTLSMLTGTQDNTFTIQGGIGSIALGTDTTYTDASEGLSDKTTYGISSAAHSYDLTSKKDYWSGWAGPSLGSADSYARVGKRFNVTGSGSRNAYIRIAGSYAGDLFGSMTGSASSRIRYRIWDATVSSFLGDDILFDESESYNLLVQHFGGTISKSTLCSLQAGHQYFVYLLGSGAVSEPIGPGTSSYDFYNTTSRFATYSSIVIDFQ